VIDASFFLSADGRDARAEYEAEHIPGAVFMDIGEIADTSNPASHMFPSEHKFASRMQSLGLGDGNRFVVYDNSPLHSAARAWFMLKSFGAHYVAILDGGMQKWKAEGRTVESGRPKVRHGHFTASLDPEAVADKEYVSGIVHSDNHEIADARSPSRFAGEEPEPRAGLAAGHIPGSKNLPQGRLFNADNSWKQGDQLRAAFEAAGVDLSKPMVTTCGSGVTACVLLFGAHLLSKEDAKLYDGSWSEWGADPATPKASGPQ
jgi:thiosulfate/3-mercaptopyruvate sulfurtransferase